MFALWKRVGFHLVNAKFAGHRPSRCTIVADQHDNADAVSGQGLNPIIAFLFHMRPLCGGLMGSPPQRPSDDQRWLNAPLRQTESDAANFLHRPADQGYGFACVTLAADFLPT